MSRVFAQSCLALFAFSAAAYCQTTATGKIERIKVHGKSLEGNLSQDAPERDVSVYLPPSYATEPTRRYPVLYFLHGFTDSDEKWFGLVKHWINLPAVLDKAFADTAMREFIVVMPNAFTRFAGSMYSSSPVTGDWERFVSEDLVAAIDTKYRTVRRREARGIAGHSMGGYGTLRIGMKNPKVYAGMYALSPCCTAASMTAQSRPEAGTKAEAVKADAEFDKADFMTKAAIATAAAWSPNPKAPPFFIDLGVKDGKVQPRIMEKWAANTPLAMIDQYIWNLKSMSLIALDSGTKDEPIAGGVRSLHEVLTTYDLPHFFEIYEGDHLNRIADRIETKVVPMFSKLFEAVRQTSGNRRPAAQKVRRIAPREQATPGANPVQ
jgi:enterochelin esterase-like enzyme